MTENTMTPPRGDLKPHHTANGTNGHSNGNGGEARLSFKAVQEQLDRVKTSLRQVLVELTVACSTLKAVEREQKSTTREIETVRAKLRDIQSVAI